MAPMSVPRARVRLRRDCNRRVNRSTGRLLTVLEHLERCGYVERIASTHDSRATMVRFTPRGERMLAGVAGGLFAIAERADPGGALETED